MKIHLETLPSIGRELHSPICNNSAVILALLGRKSFSAEQVVLMRKMGWEVDIIRHTAKTLKGKKPYAKR